MPSCVIKHCKSCSQKQKKEDGISFHRFPTDPVLRGEWITIIRQSRQNKDWLPSKFCVVCSLHFQEDDLYFTETGRRFLKKTSIPTKKLSALPPEKSNIAESLMSKTALQDQGSPSNTLEVSPLEKSIGDNTNEVPGTIDSDLDFLFDTARNSQLRKHLRKHKLLRVTDKRKLKTLQQKNRRLQKRNDFLKKKLKELKKKYEQLSK